MAPSPPQAPTTGLSAMAAQTPVKSISARLMTMKFMQRAVASDPSSPTTPNTNESGSGKRRKVSHTPVSDSPRTPLFDVRAAQAAIEEEEKKREAAVARLALQLGDSHWVLEGAPKTTKGQHVPLKVVQVGFAQIDSSSLSNETEDDVVQGKKTFGAQPVKGNAAKKGKAQKATNSDEDMSTSGSDSEKSRPREQADRGRRESVRDGDLKRSNSTFSQKRGEERKKSQQIASKRRKKELNLNKPISISAQGASGHFGR